VTSPPGGAIEPATGAVEFEVARGVGADMGQARMTRAEDVSPTSNAPRPMPSLRSAWPEAPEPPRRPSGQAQNTAPAGKQWGEGVDWPAEWRKSESQEGPASNPKRPVGSEKDQHRDDKPDGE
jgi:hypothetical protein